MKVGVNLLCVVMNEVVRRLYEEPFASSFDDVRCRRSLHILNTCFGTFRKNGRPNDGKLVRLH